MTERRVKKNTKDDDTCRDCWKRRFRSEMMKLFSESANGPKFFNEELTLREELYDAMRRDGRDVYDEITEIRSLAGDVFMDRYSNEEKKKK